MLDASQLDARHKNTSEEVVHSGFPSAPRRHVFRTSLRLAALRHVILRGLFSSE